MSEIDFSSIVRLLPDLIAVADRSGVVYANPGWMTTLGRAPEEIVGGDFFGLVHPDDVEETRRVIEAVWQGRPNDAYGNRIAHHDGHHVDIRWSLVAGDGLLYASGRDITRYRTIREELAESLAISTGVLATAVDPIIVIDETGIVLEANQATAQLFGHDLDWIIGGNVSRLMPEPYRGEHDGYLAAYLGGGEPQVIGRGREVEARRADGSTFPIQLSVSEVVTDRRRLFTGIIHDLTERNRQRDDLRRAAEVLEARVADRTADLQQLLAEFERSNEDLERFAYIASHDLQAPLRNVRQGLELLDEHLTTQGHAFDTEALELQSLVLASVGRMEQLIGGLLSYSRVQTSEDQQTPETLDLQLVVDELLQVLLADLDEADAEVVVGPLPSLVGRESLISQVVQNLISNAIRFRSPDRPLQITIAAVVDGDHVELTVADNGVGVEDGQHERIFEMFRKGQNSEEGVGIGLALCRRIVEGHGGSIRVDSASGEGAAFICRFPQQGVSRNRDLRL